MSHSYAIRSALIALLLISATLVQTTIIDIPYTDERVFVTPKTDWSYLTYNMTGACPGIWTRAPGENHTISLYFTGVGIIVHGYAVSQPVSWNFKIDDGPSEDLYLAANMECNAIKDKHGLKNGRHRVTLTPRETNFVLTKFSVTQDDLSNAEIIGIAIGCTSAVLAIPGIYFGFKEWSRRKKAKSWFC